MSSADEREAYALFRYGCRAVNVLAELDCLFALAEAALRMGGTEGCSCWLYRAFPSLIKTVALNFFYRHPDAGCRPVFLSETTQAVFHARQLR